MLGFLLKFQGSEEPEGKEEVSLQTLLYCSGLCLANKGRQHADGGTAAGLQTCRSTKLSGAQRLVLSSSPASSWASFLVSAEYLSGFYDVVCVWCLVR